MTAVAYRSGETFFIESFGCTLNASDAELVEHELTRAGLSIVEKIDDAWMVVVNTCGVKVPTEQKIMHKIRTYSRLQGKVLVITGCLPLIYKGNLSALTQQTPGFAAIFGPRDYHHLTTVVPKIKAGERGIIQMEGSSIDTKGKLRPTRHQQHIAILPIAEGCTGACHYCCTRFARGSLVAYPLNHLTTRLREFLLDGVKEVWITAEDCSAYVDPGTGGNLGHLLKDLSAIQGTGATPFFLRVGMMNPATLLPVIDGVMDAYASPRVFKLLHVPVQSGSDDVLQSMNRRYTAEQFMYIIDVCKKSYPAITIATDVICGYPTETDDDFKKTMTLIERVAPDIINISMYGHRPGTVASSLKSLDASVVKARSKMITGLHERITSEKQARWIGWKGNAIIEEYNKQTKNWLCRTKDFRPVIVDDIKDSKLGDIVEIKIYRAIRHYFKGIIIA